MQLKKTIHTTGKVLCIIFVGIVCCVLLLFTLFVAAVYLHPVPKPEITYAEFPFKLTYELDGETIVIEDTIVCEFDGFRVIGEAGKYRQWKIYLKNGDERVTLLDFRPDGQVNKHNEIMLRFYFYYGNGEYYMGDDSYNIGKPEQEFNRYISYEYLRDDGKIGYGSYTSEDAYKIFGIKLIEWDCAPPIENNFK